jgi:hypothetical protein
MFIPLHGNDAIYLKNKKENWSYEKNTEIYVGAYGLDSTIYTICAKDSGSRVQGAL